VSKKALWVGVFGAGTEKKKPKRVNQISRRQRKRNEEYLAAARMFKIQHPVCGFHDHVMKCVSKTEDIHHMRGKIGPLLMDQRHWMPVCRHHHNWIANNIEIARQRGFICPKGLWNTPDATVDRR